MPSYYAVSVHRSDGQLQVLGKDGRMEPNQPTDDQMSQKVEPEKTGDYKDYYHKVERGSEKDIDWRRKLGGMLMHLAGTPEHLKKNWILDNLPENFILWEHVKYAVNENGDAKKSGSTHAAGGYERQDAYLYGHPQGRKKRYRSPTEFFEHLLWLAADDPDNPSQCCCKICMPILPDELGLDAEDSKVINEQPKATKTQTLSAPKTQNLGVPKAQILSVPKTQTQNAPKNQTLNAPANIPKPVSSNPTLVGNPIPDSRTLEQFRDREINSPWLYRLGELVWYSKGPAWGLAIIQKRGSRFTPPEPRYMLQPLSNPLRHAQYCIKNREDDIRPWLAWSVPSTCHPLLNNLTFDTVPWQRVINGEFGRYDAEVDGSILAAKAIDNSYSFFSRFETKPANPNIIHWNALFLGAEKVWVGDPVYLRRPNDSDPNTEIHVLVIHEMIERVQSSNPNTSEPSNSNPVIIGDIYKFQTINLTTTKTPDPPPPHLPLRMTSDLRFRNEAARTIHQHHTWILVQSAAHRSIADIKGRWYETKKLLPILRTPHVYQSELSRGITSDVGTWMNGRGDSNTGPEEGGIRKKNRRDTLGLSVPADFAISRGKDALDKRGMQYDDCAFPGENERGESLAVPGARPLDPSRVGVGPAGVSFEGTYGGGQCEQMDDDGNALLDPGLGDDEGADLDQFMNLDGAGVGSFYADSMEH